MELAAQTLDSGSMKGLDEDDRASKIRYARRGEFAYLPAGLITDWLRSA